MGQQLTTMTSGQRAFPVAPVDLQNFAQHGKSSTWLSELLPYTAKIADDICIIKSMQTEAINHDPAITFVQTGSQLAGRPSMGAGPLTALAARIRICRRSLCCCRGGTEDQPVYDRLWGSGFLPTCGTTRASNFAAARNPCYTSTTRTACQHARRGGRCSTTLATSIVCALRCHRRPGNPDARGPVRDGLSPKMQTSVPDQTNVSKEPAKVLDRATGRTFTSRAATRPTVCWRAGSRSAACASFSFSTWGGTITAICPKQIRNQCRDTDQPSAAAQPGFAAARPAR